MPLANIRNLPATDTSRQEYDFHHWQDHLALLQAAQARFGNKLTAYPIWPLPDHDTFLKLHQAFHDDLAPILGLTNTDLKTLDPEDANARTDWGWRNYQFHAAAHAVLKI